MPWKMIPQPQIYHALRNACNSQDGYQLQASYNVIHAVGYVIAVQYSGKNGRQNSAAVFQRVCVRHLRDASDVTGRQQQQQQQQRTCRYRSDGSQVTHISGVDI